MNKPPKNYVGWIRRWIRTPMGNFLMMPWAPLVCSGLPDGCWLVLNNLPCGDVNISKVVLPEGVSPCVQGVKP